MERKRILIVTTFFPPQNSSASLRSYSWAKYWSRMGHDVTVLTTEKDSTLSECISLEMSEFKVVEIPSLKKKPSISSQNPSASLISKFLFWLRNKYGVLNACRFPDLTEIWIRKAWDWVSKSNSQWDIVVSTAGPYTTHKLASKLKKNGRVHEWIADYRDLWSNSYIYSGLFPLNLFEKAYERKLLKSCNRITTVSQGLRKALSRLFPMKPVEVVENGFDQEDYEDLPRKSYFPNDGKFRVVYTGLIYEGKRDPTPLFRAIQCLAQDPIIERLEVVFVGPSGKVVEDLIKEYDVGKWVRYGGFVSRRISLQMQRDAQALLFLPWNDIRGEGTLTGKLFEYLASSTPIWAVGCDHLNEPQRLLRQLEVGELLGTDVSKIVTLLKNVLSEALTSNKPISFSSIERFSRSELAKKMLLPSSQPQKLQGVNND